MAHILLLEPDTVLSSMYQAVFERNGHSVVCVTGAQAAIAAADEYQPDVVVMELNLAGHNGVEFLYEFRSYTDWQHTPAIVISTTPASTLQVSEEVWRGLNIARYHYKPLTRLWDLVRSVEVVLQNTAAVA